MLEEIRGCLEVGWTDMGFETKQFKERTNLPATDSGMICFKGTDMEAMGRDKFAAMTSDDCMNLINVKSILDKAGFAACRYWRL